MRVSYQELANAGFTDANPGEAENKLLPHRMVWEDGTAKAVFNRSFADKYTLRDGTGISGITYTMDHEGGITFPIDFADIEDLKLFLEIGETAPNRI
tara:strand:+ start:1025 stop:1315 length:291 start_codon:yes stop_codon:yes gene_type:complete